MKKLSIKLFATVALMFTATVATMAQGSFAYQAVIRNDDGSAVSNKEVNVKFTLHQDKTVYYSETQKIKTNAYGNITAMVGSGTKESGDFMSVPWSSMNVMLKIEVDGKDMGSIQLQPVPYALYAKETSKVTQAATANNDDAIFEVKDSQGNLVFAVYPYGVKVFVDDSETASKLKRSGFLVTGREATKGEGTSDYFAVTAEGTQVFVDNDDSKLKRSGFLVTGREATKEGSTDNYLKVDGDGTHVYVDLDDNGSKLKRSGFLVTGREATKDGKSVDVFKIDGEGTQVFIDDESGSKLKRSGFLVTGREATKDGDANKYLSVTSDSIDFSSSSFNVADKKTSNKVLTVTNGNVHVNSDMLLTGEIGKVVETFETYETINNKTWEDAEVGGGSTIQITANDFFSQVGGNTVYPSFLKIIDNNLVVPQTSINTLYFDANGQNVSSEEDATIKVYIDDWDYNNTYNIIIALKPNTTFAGATISFGLQIDNGYDYSDREDKNCAVEVVLPAKQ
ncbi:MAG: hypothetical protein IKW77_11625 [Salinivirgaceae bacterium]|nr:hypothetical protein [Salinivirgaceae bacterium]